MTNEVVLMAILDELRRSRPQGAPAPAGPVVMTIEAHRCHHCGTDQIAQDEVYCRGCLVRGAYTSIRPKYGSKYG